MTKKIYNLEEERDARTGGLGSVLIVCIPLKVKKIHPTTGEMLFLGDGEFCVGVETNDPEDALEHVCEKLKNMFEKENTSEGKNDEKEI